jgi:hypothetical protein
MVELEQLGTEIAEARRQKMFPSLEAIERWYILVQAVIQHSRDEWQPEPVFRLRTGASYRWCRGHFAGCEQRGLARRNGKKRREWHVSVRPPKARPSDDGAAVDEIVEGMTGRRTA